MRRQTPNSKEPVASTETHVVPQRKLDLDLVQFDQSDQIQISPRDSPKHPNISSAQLATPSNTGQLQKQKINNMLQAIKRNQGSLPNTRKPLIRQSLALEQGGPPLLIQQLNNLEQEMIKHREVEKFMIMFAKNPENAIQYVVGKGEIQNTPEEIAGYLIQRQAINKVALGEYFGKNKERVLEILREYCRCLDFRGLEFDKALRCLLSKFKLPGEAQQIQRIVYIFSQVYFQSHDTQFANADQIHVLSYSLIMLNTDAHNPMQQKKMTKAQFIKNTSPVCPRIPHAYLQAMYDRITRDKFQTQTVYMQKIYELLHNLNLHISARGVAQVLNSTVQLTKGHIFIKYCRNRAKGVMRRVYISQKEDQLLWVDPNIENDEPRFILLKDMTDLILGCSSEVMRMNKISRDFDPMCFTIVTKHRTLDLNARNPDNRAKWVNYLGAFLIHRRENHRKERQAIFKTYFNKEKIEEIWNTDIFPNWDSHWDYRLKRPKQKKYQTFLKKLREFCCCSQDTRDQVYQVHAGEYERILPIKTPLLQALWRYGLPPNSRKTLWPIVIGNALGITPVLYQMYNKKKKQIHQIHHLPYSSQSITLVQILAVIRPDISLVRNLLELAQVFTRYLNQYDAFVSFANMMHSYYFLAFFQGDITQIDFRVKFFDYLVDKNLPLVAGHFRALEINSKMFMVPWFLEIFSSCFDEEEFLARIWDNFFLEGEIYLFKVGLAIIKYYEFELKMSTFEEVIKLLSHPRETSEVYFFEILESQIQVQQSEFDDYIEKRKFAVIKTRVQEIPLE